MQYLYASKPLANTHIYTSIKPRLNQLDRNSHRAYSKPRINPGRIVKVKRMFNTLQYQDK